MSGTAPYILTSIDVGTSKIAILVAELDSSGRLTLLGGTHVPSRGLRQGVVTDLGAAAEAIADAVARVEEWQGEPIDQAYISIGGGHVRARRIHGSTTPQPWGRPVEPDDVADAIRAARASFSLGENRDLLHMVPSGYTVDQQDGIRNPVGMSARTLDVDVHVVTATSTHIQNLLNCLAHAGVEAEHCVAAPIAASVAIPAAPHGELCTAVIDIGAETMSIAVRADGSILHSAVVPLGGAHLTQSLARALRLRFDAAEALKRKAGHCDPAAVADDELIELAPFTGTDEITPRQVVASILRESACVLAEQVIEVLEPLRYDGISPAMLFLTGGGATLPGIDQVFAHATEIPTEIASARGIEAVPPALSAPAFTVAAGLLLWGTRPAQRAMRAAPAVSEPLQPAGLLTSCLAAIQRLLSPVRAAFGA